NTGNLAIRGSYNQLSDARFKANVRTFGNALDVLRRLRGVTFNWKPERNDNPNLQIGFIAQEVETVLPEVVTTDMDGYKSVSYANIVPVLVEAIKQQQTQIEAQTRQINEQARQIEALRSAFCQANAQSAFL
ncbi:MAG TPA: tail fiber domain-containing protein, partial [Pyrinomonadaceae bacterium]|nr:tail fiber domain-containing protein [Pyrinomonadaceae bacterium]